MAKTYHVNVATRMTATFTRGRHSETITVSELPAQEADTVEHP
jgi:hypothetical protein